MMVLGCVKTAVELEFSRTNSWSMVNILDLLHRFSFHFIKNGGPTILIDSAVYKNGG